MHVSHDDNAATDGAMDEAEVETLSRLANDVDDSEVPSGGLFSFYDGLRDRITGYLSEKGGKLGGPTADALMLVPDVFILLVRLSLDKNVPAASRTLIGSALAYFVLPFDVLPEAIVGPAGYADDLVLALAVLAKAFGRDLEPWSARYWNGSQPLRRVIGDVLGASHHLLG
ncbi:MAG: DUF1232 domain-containing protein, partial [Acidobacteriota bacterium]